MDTISTILYLEYRSMAAIPHSDMQGPPTITSAFFCKINFSIARRTSLVGTPGSSSRESIISSLRGRITPPTLTPPAALISSAAKIIPLSPFWPYALARGTGAPTIMGLPFFAALALTTPKVPIPINTTAIIRVMMVLKILLFMIPSFLINNYK